MCHLRTCLGPSLTHQQHGHQCYCPCRVMLWPMMAMANANASIEMATATTHCPVLCIEMIQCIYDVVHTTTLIGYFISKTSYNRTRPHHPSNFRQNHHIFVTSCNLIRTSWHWATLGFPPMEPAISRSLL